MATLQELCLNTIENNGTSVREVLKDAPVSKKYTHRHPVLKISTRQFFSTADGKLYPELDEAALEVDTDVTIEFDGVYTVNWIRSWFCTDATLQKLASEFMKRDHPESPLGSGSFQLDTNTIDTVTTIMMEPRPGIQIPIYKNQFLEEIKKVVHDCKTITTSLLAPSGEKIMELWSQSDPDYVPDSDWDGASYVDDLEAVVKGLRRLSICQ